MSITRLLHCGCTRCNDQKINRTENSACSGLKYFKHGCYFRITSNSTEYLANGETWPRSFHLFLSIMVFAGKYELIHCMVKQSIIRHFLMSHFDL